MIRLLLTFALSSLLLACQGTVPQQSHQQVSAAGLQRLTNVPGVERFYRVSPALYRGAQPDAEGYRRLAAMGVKTVLSFRNFNDTRAAAEAAGLHYESLPIYAALGSEPPSSTVLRRFLAVMSDPDLQPVFVHCKHGRDRTGAMCAIYRMEFEGWSRERALREMKELGFRSFYRDLKRFVRDYQPRGSAPVY